MMNERSKEVNITKDEAALYDRQIRLWGLDAQKRLRASKVLLIGMRGLSAEIAKNIVLAGINSLVLLDSHTVDDEDFASQFLISHSDLGKNRATASLKRVQQLNPMVSVSVEAGTVDDKSDVFLKSFDVICATGCDSKTMLRLDAVCRSGGVNFFAGDVFGFFGYMFVDLGSHEFVEEKKDPYSSLLNNTDGASKAKKAKIENPQSATVKHMTFPSMLDALKSRFDSVSMDVQKNLKLIPNTFFVFKVLLEFLDIHKRRPNIKNFDSDVIALSGCRKDFLERESLPDIKIPANFDRHCFGQLNAVCAIVGGILTQEIIKAISQRGAPHGNFFFYNGTDDGGVAASIGW